jgi:outer membrane protein assembly factor BamA
MNVQYVRHLNTENYFNIYRSSYDRLNEIAQDSGFPFSDPETNMLIIPDETQEFIDAALSGEGPPLNLSPEEVDEILGIDERRFRLTENNLIFATNFTWTRDSRENIFDNNFSRLRWKIETAGNLLSVVSGLAGLEKDENGKYKALGVVYSQYAKGEIEYIKHWLMSDNTIFAIRLFGGIAVPYGNSESIPFTRSYFAGGANDNRGWRPYNLGPGSSGSFLDFNEANFKLAFNAEYRYTIIGDFKGAFFADVGNIWNVFDNVKDEASRFNGIGDLKELAFATGFGLRYDFGFFVLRFDVGFKTYNPALPEDERWFKEYNFRNAVYNIGINYPF